MPWAAAAIAGSAVIGGITSMSAADTAAGAAKDSAALQQQQYQTTRGDLLPYNQAGQSALPGLQALATGGVTGGGPDYVSQAAAMQPGQMTQAQLEATPGYQFNLTQGLQAAQNSAAARGLGVSGAALKGAATFATGLADSTYQNQFNNAQTRFTNTLGLNTAQQGNLTNQYNRLSGIAGMGENAAAQTGVQGTALANAAGNSLTAAGNASAAGTLGIGNAVTGGVNNYLGYNALQGYLSKNSGGQTGGYQDTTSTFADG